jgi:ActR/RegA family two-component response regulator
MENRNRVLFVDDEPNLRFTFPDILKLHGFDVRCAATVSEALAEMTSHPFDVLISDLNIGEPGDGFTVVSAMRRTQPECVNLIVTGFPAFETALRAIQRQVDFCLVKPANIDELVSTIRNKLKTRQPHQQTPLLRLSQLVQEHVEEIVGSVLDRMKAHPVLGTIRMSDEARSYCLRTMLTGIAHQLDSPEPEVPTELALEAARALGLQRQTTGYAIAMLVAEAAIVQDVVFDMVRERLLLLDTSYLVVDLKSFNDGLQVQLQESVQAFWDETAGSQQIGQAG